MNDFIVPVDDAINKFNRHLKAYPRTILSAKFGDGKSFFIQKIKNNSKLLKEYKFLTIYPVNYQVTENKDIFEILKRDILFQLIIENMISDEITLSEQDSLSWFLHQKGGNLIIDLISSLTEIGLENEYIPQILAAFRSIKLFKEIKEKFKNFKKEKLQSDEDRILDFLEKTDNTLIYECDIITQIIKKVIQNYQEKERKKVVLFVEDMDRIDPAHLFRILNVLSAHMDYCYKYSAQPDTSLVGNKFGLDNIVLVIDYRNLKGIYKHFYGEHTDFGGYISKFLSGVPFYYSLEKQKYNYVVNKLAELTDLDCSFIKSIFTEEIINSQTMRETVQSFCIRQDTIPCPVVHREGKEIFLDTSFLRLMTVMRRLKWTDEEIIESILKTKTDNLPIFIRYVLPYMFLYKGKSNDKLSLPVNINDRSIDDTTTIIELNPDTGIISSCSYRNRFPNEKETDLKMYISLMLNLII